METKTNRMNVTIVGYGMMGKEREKALLNLGITPYKILDKDDLITDHILEHSDWVFVCTPPVVSVQIIDRIREGFPYMKILVEKPYLGDHKDVFVGYNYRFYKGVEALLNDISNDLFGNLISVNMTLAMGDAPGTDKGWRLNPKMTGGGVMYDLGVHLIDLAMIISNHNLELEANSSWCGFWNNEVAEEHHLLARDYCLNNSLKGYDRNTIFNIQVSKDRWHSEFKIEVNGTEGYGIVEGRNRHYGKQTYRRGEKWGWRKGVSQKETEELVVDYDGEDSFYRETFTLLNIPAISGLVGTYHSNKEVLNFISNL